MELLTASTSMPCARLTAPCPIAEARAAAEQHHATLSRIYVDNERFRRNIDAAQESLDAYMARAFEANAAA